MTEATASSMNRFFWPALVAVLLLGHVVLITGSLILSSPWIPAASIAPSGYEEALKWDALQAERAASERLGWTLTMTPTDQLELNGDYQDQDDKDECDLASDKQHESESA